ncbi:peptidase [Reticulomyxa filosa]|uniref:Peptidase n=1 Tax=Reticulomyxa filosa TaxID=46433 RepID=X6PAN0_RETFI|nr:peptidase [Reticulomyxa filosa]|eukprot:ETO35188.1 peptidase [Reticulomyxa filosa]
MGESEILLQKLIREVAISKMFLFCEIDYENKLSLLETFVSFLYDFITEYERQKQTRVKKGMSILQTQEMKKQDHNEIGRHTLELKSDSNRDLETGRSTCHANIRFNDSGAALRCKKRFHGEKLEDFELSVVIESLYGKANKLQKSLNFFLRKKKKQDDVWVYLPSTGPLEAWAINTSNYAPMSVRMEFDNEIYDCHWTTEVEQCLQWGCEDSVIVVLFPQSTCQLDQMKAICICKLTRKDNNKTQKKQRAIIGDEDKATFPKLQFYSKVNVLARHDSKYEYLLPFALDFDIRQVLGMSSSPSKDQQQINDGNGDKEKYQCRHRFSFLCSQGPGGTFSHACGSYVNSYDFAVTVGTPVVAPRSGYVVDIEQQRWQHGPELEYEEYCNYVTILHSDGSFCDLVHLRFRSIRVAIGDFVKAGQLVGYGGNTGFSGEPHVHVMVYIYRLVQQPNRFTLLKWQSLPVLFKQFQPSCGRYYGQFSMYYQNNIKKIVKGVYFDEKSQDLDIIHPLDITAWGFVDFTFKPKKPPLSLIDTVDETANRILAFGQCDLTLLRVDVAIIPLCYNGDESDWLIGRLLARGGKKLIDALVSQGLDIMKLLCGEENLNGKEELEEWRNKQIGNTYFVNTEETYLGPKNVLMMVTKGNYFTDCQLLEINRRLLDIQQTMDLTIDIIGLELTRFEQMDRECTNRMLSTIRSVFMDLKYVRRFVICTETLHDAHQYAPLIFQYFPRKPTTDKDGHVYVPHCPCHICSRPSFGLGKFYLQQKIHEHQFAIGEGISEELIHLNGIVIPVPSSSFFHPSCHPEISTDIVPILSFCSPLNNSIHSEDPLNGSAHSNFDSLDTFHDKLYSQLSDSDEIPDADNSPNWQRSRPRNKPKNRKNCHTDPSSSYSCSRSRSRNKRKNKNKNRNTNENKNNKNKNKNKNKNENENDVKSKCIKPTKSKGAKKSASVCFVYFVYLLTFENNDNAYAWSILFSVRGHIGIKPNVQN